MNLLYFSYFSLLLLLDGLLIGHFAYRRYKFMREDPHNANNFYYWRATIFISIGFLFYSLPNLLLGNNVLAISYGAFAGVIFHTLGFSYFMLIPFHVWLQKFFRWVKILPYVAAFFAFILLMAQPPNSFVGDYGIIHWRFSLPTSIFMLSLESLASIFNVVYLVNYFRFVVRQYFKLYFVNFALMGSAFILTALGGGYLYIGDDTNLLAAANIILFLGIVPAFLSLRGGYGGDG